VFNAGNTTSDVYQVWRLAFRNVEWMQQAVAAALALLTDEYNWNPSSDINAETAADFGIEVTLSFLPIVNMVGVILPFGAALTDIPSGCLACDGASYLRSDYSALFAKIGTIWGSADSTHFNVPDLRSVAPIGAGQQSPFSNRTLGAVLGEESHTLSTGEMPAHTHTESSTIPTPITIGEIPAVTITSSASITGSAGGGGAHNNMQPSVVVNFIIVAVFA
jgi:microcystin-dependent protein